LTAQQVPPSHLKHLAGDAGGGIDEILSRPGMGAALFSDGSNRMVMSYGTYRAEIPHRFPPGAVGTMALAAYCPPGPAGPTTMRSPLLAARDEAIPQIAAPPRQPTRTVYPIVPAMGGPQTPPDWMHVLVAEPAEAPDEVRLLPGADRQPTAPPTEPPQPSVEPSPLLTGAAWWDAHLNRR
jgi:hypothetical protein